MLLEQIEIKNKYGIEAIRSITLIDIQIQTDVVSDYVIDSLIEELTRSLYINIPIYIHVTVKCQR